MTTYQVTVDAEGVQQLLRPDDGLAELVSAVLNQILETEVAEQLQAGRKSGPGNGRATAGC